MVEVEVKDGEAVAEEEAKDTWEEEEDTKDAWDASSDEEAEEEAVPVKGNITGLDKKKFQRKIVNIFLPINFNICFGCSKEPSH